MSAPPNPNPYQSSQRFSSLNSFDLEDDEFELLFGEGPSQPVVEESLDEAPVEEVALCKAWINNFEDNKEGNGKKTNWFWTAVTAYLHRETGSMKRSYDAVNYKWKNRIRPKSTSDSSHIALNLNDEAADSGDEEIEESRPVGQYKTKRMGSTFDARSASSATTDTSLVHRLLSNFTHCETPLFSSRKDASIEYLRIKERELEMQDQRRREEAELERLKLAQAKKFEE
ncbi:hypothetical protein Tco_1093751 [Tanacetum coccineum]|uniref:No apical meristem-associated C-terminal domain-containing protein n=1 Tax=Tanacetum coccineum TaxID=301880 RepID=A0ABQ5IDN5_9ASTR